MLKQANLGCSVGLNYVGCIVYADDIILLSQSVSCMQKMLNMCDLYAAEFDVKFNSTKSVALRIGPRYEVNCATLLLCSKPLCYVAEVKYLGMTIVAKRNFNVNFDKVKKKFYRSFNAIYSKSKFSNSELISINLMKSFCVPVITYGIESLNMNDRDCLKLDKCIKLAVGKIFGSYDDELLKDIRFYMNIPSIKDIYVNKKINLFKSMVKDQGNVHLRALFLREFLVL